MPYKGGDPHLGKLLGEFLKGFLEETVGEAVGEVAENPQTQPQEGGQCNPLNAKGRDDSPGNECDQDELRRD